MSTIAHEVLFECKAIKCWVLKKKHFAHQKKNLYTNVPIAVCEFKHEKTLPEHMSSCPC